MGRSTTKYVVLICFLALGSYISMQQANQALDESNTRTVQGRQHSKDNNIANNFQEKSIREAVVPKKIISVIGLESSGTQFMTDVLAKAVRVRGRYREGSRANTHGMNDNGVQVQHFSLPWGTTCQAHPKQIIQNVVLPFPCSGTVEKMSNSCKEWAREANMDRHPSEPTYPPRYFLDIIKNKEFYESKGVEQVFVIVLRDRSISFASRKGHCNMTQLREAEELIGTDIIVRAINKYILNKPVDRRLSHESLYDEVFWGEYNNITDDGDRRRLSSALPSGSNVFLVSYESLLKLKEVYIAMIYDALGIESDYMPAFKDGNQKYVSAPAKVVSKPYFSQPARQNSLKYVNRPAEAPKGEFNMEQHKTQKQIRAGGN